jgi:NAD(P)-dependent dehydrogenase (short-subunit alcohol dehydrogenase family)
MTGTLADKIAVVIGGSSGIGLGIAKRFAQEGAHVFYYRSPPIPTG